MEEKPSRSLARDGGLRPGETHPRGIRAGFRPCTKNNVECCVPSPGETAGPVISAVGPHPSGTSLGKDPPRRTDPPAAAPRPAMQKLAFPGPSPLLENLPTAPVLSPEPPNTGSDLGSGFAATKGPLGREADDLEFVTRGQNKPLENQPMPPARQPMLIDGWAGRATVAHTDPTYKGPCRFFLAEKDAPAPTRIPSRTRASRAARSRCSATAA